MKKIKSQGTGVLADVVGQGGVPVVLEARQAMVQLADYLSGDAVRLDAVDDSSCVCAEVAENLRAWAAYLKEVPV